MRAGFDESPRGAVYQHTLVPPGAVRYVAGMSRIIGSLVVLPFVACMPAPGALPAGTTCSRWSTASTDAELSTALSGASSGTCVALQAGQYRQPLVVSEGVSVVSVAGATVELLGGSETQPTVTLAPRAVLAGVEVVGAPGIGVSGSGKGSKLFQSKVRGAKKFGVVFWCEEDCRTDDFSEVLDTTLTGNAVGLFTRGVRVKVKNGAISQSGGTSLTAGYGVVAAAGAVLEVEGTSVEQNETLGVLVDGAQNTDASLTRVTVRENKGRGIWAQGLLGTMAAPKLRLADSTVERNLLTGVGARGSKGLQISGGRIAGTQTGSAVSGPGQLVMVGDGLGLFEGTGDVQVDGAVLEANQRAQAVVDQAVAGVTVASSVMVTPGAGLGLVVQRTTATVQAPNQTVLTGANELTVSSPSLGVPTR